MLLIFWMGFNYFYGKTIVCADAPAVQLQKIPCTLKMSQEKEELCKSCIFRIKVWLQDGQDEKTFFNVTAEVSIL
jgi:hypothetical protein